MDQYLRLLDKVVSIGWDKSDRTGTGTCSLFGAQMRFNLTYTFPLLTTKTVHLKSVIRELLWFLKGDTNTHYLNEHDVRIWDEWADENGDLGPIYGKQWRSWEKPNGETVDQIQAAIDLLKADPNSRRNIVSAWNVSDLDRMALQPCHTLFQFYSRERTKEELLEDVLVHPELDTNDRADLRKRYVKMAPPPLKEVLEFVQELGVPARALSCQLYQRSADLFLGVPFNIASYSLLTLMIAKLVNMVPEEFVHTIGDAHIYNNHLDQVAVQLSRRPRPLPSMTIRGSQETIDDFRYEDFVLEGYNPYSSLPGPVAV